MFKNINIDKIESERYCEIYLASEDEALKLLNQKPDLIEEMTPTEMLAFHHQFKPLIHPANEILEEVGLSAASNKEVRFFSSGMKQRLKLAQAFFSETSVMLLDEPTTNLDTEGISVYRKLIESFSKNRLVIVCSNDKAEYEFCREIVSVEKFK